MSRRHASDPFSSWGYGERRRCDDCGQYESLPESPVRPTHKPGCPWAARERRRREAAARRILGITREEVDSLKAARRGGKGASCSSPT